ncbi:hypothetical protein [Flavobacterium sp. CS20]|uniref:hypothetical protein n=1 Tax=Flavobacterium sp. CS20 TaxID=2775246 RepID=UPI001B3A2499|nr:hypothetical protein [Flavobacterium sp. CS20]QTY27287.1 hypothetical protein IGB25_01505 [Flavobacterium sp. CS20]
MLFLMLAVFTLSTSGFSINSSIESQEDCDALAEKAYRISEEYGDSQAEMNANYFNFY